MCSACSVVRGVTVEPWEMPIDTGEVPADGSDFDVIVVGGGPGGSAAAAYNALNGCKVLLIEKNVWPRDKVCGDAVGGKSLSHVCLLYTSPSPRDRLLSRMPSSA